MFIIFGWGRRTMQTLGWLSPRTCSNCHNEGPWALVRIRRWFSLFFIPVIPYETDYVAMCPVCSRGINVDKREASNLVQGGRAISGSETRAGISGPSSPAVTGLIGSPRRRGRKAFVVAGVLAALILAVVLIGALQNNGNGSGSATASSVASGVPMIPAVADAYKPTSHDLDRLVTLIKGVVGLANNNTTFPDGHKARVLMAARFSSMATELGVWRTSYSEASPSTVHLCGCAIVNAKAIAGELRTPTKRAFARYEKSRLALNKAINSWDPTAALAGQ